MSYKTVLWNTLMMAVKHVLGPKRAVTPPGSPAARGLMNTAGRRVPLLAREPFPVELVTVEKLNEILRFIKLEHGEPQQNRIERLEQGLADTKQDLSEIKLLLMDVVTNVKQQKALADVPASSAVTPDGPPS